MGRKLVVIGADAAGMTAASMARRRDRDLDVVAYERTTWASYAACGEPYYIAGYVPELEDLVARTPEQFARAGIDLRLRHEVVAIDTAARTVTVHDLEADRTFEDGYDELLIATGARAFVPPIPGVDLDGVHTLRTLGDAEALRQVADGGQGNAVVVGGGYIGLEVAEAFHAKGWDVTVVEAAPAVLPRTLDTDLGLEVADRMRAMGLVVHVDAMVTAIEGDPAATKVVAGDLELPADVVVLGIGSRPVVEPAEAAGIALGPTGAIAVDDHQRTSAEHVWSAGDCAETSHRITGRPVNYHLGTVANKTGRVAGMNLTGGDFAFPGVLGSAITKVNELEIASTGLRRGDAEAAGFDAVDATVKGLTTAHYWPGHAEMTIRVTVERGSGRLLGAQIVGGPGAGKRIDVFATAIWQAMAAADLSWVDLSYAPPFSPVWDLVAIAARKAGQAAKG